MGRDLVAFEPPLTQVLSLPPRGEATAKRAPGAGGAPWSLGDILAEIGARRAREE